MTANPSGIRAIRNGWVVTPGGVLRGGVAVDGDRIAAVAADAYLPVGDGVFDAAGCWILPGVIDPDGHLGTSLDSAFDLDFASESRAAVGMGTTTSRAGLGGRCRLGPYTLRGQVEGASMSVSVPGQRFAVVAVLAALLATGCGAGATPTPTGPLAFHIQLTPSHVSVAIAVDQGFYQRVKPSYTLVGYGESSQLFHAGTDPIGNESPWETAVYQDQGKDIRYFSTVEASNALQGITIRTADAAKYKSVPDLKGQKLGIPGFGTGVWAALQVVTKAMFGLEAKSDFQIIEGNPGDLEGLLQTKAIEAMITFAAPTAHALANPNYKMLYNLSEEWNKAKGAYLPANGWEADAKFLDANLEAMKDFVAGTQKGLDYLKAHPELNKKGGKYEQFAVNEGVLVSPETTAFVDQKIKEGLWYLPDSLFTQKWIDAVYEFIQLGDGILLPKGKVPSKDKVFYLPMLK